MIASFLVFFSSESHDFTFNYVPSTAQKVSVFGIILVQMRENTNQNNSEYGHFLRSVPYSTNMPPYAILTIIAWLLEKKHVEHNISSKDITSHENC